MNIFATNLVSVDLKKLDILKEFLKQLTFF